MSPAKRFLLTLGAVALVVWIGANVLMGPPGLSRDYLADHDFYLRCQRQGVRLLIAQHIDVFVDETRTSVAAEMA